MPRNFNLADWRSQITRDPRLAVRIALGALVLANLGAALWLFRPWGGSSAALQEQTSVLRQQIVKKRINIEQLKVLVNKADSARAQGDTFAGSYFLDERTYNSAIISEVLKNTKDAHVLLKDESFNRDPVEGSDLFTLVRYTARLEGTYRDLLSFLNALDHSPRFLTIESLQAAPQQGQGAKKNLDITLQLDAYLRANEAGI